MDWSLLTGSPLFRGMTNSEIENTLSKVTYRIKKFGIGAMISQNGEPVNSMIIVLKGIVKGEMVDFAGRIIKIEDIHAPGALAPAFMFGQRNMFPVNVIAISEGELLLIEKSDFLKLIKRNDVILVNFLDLISNRSQFLSEKIKFLNFKTIKGKLAQYILKLAVDQNNEIKLDRTQNDLADYFGVARPSVTRALGEMEEKGILRVKGKWVIIIDKKGLLDLTKD